jgi:hypothetical protein
MKLFELIVRSIYMAVSVTPKVDKNGREFVSFKFDTTNLKDRQKRFFLKSVAMYPRQDGGVLMLVNFGGTTKNKPFSASGAVTIKMVRPELYILLRKNKKEGMVWQDQVNLLRGCAGLSVQAKALSQEQY